MISLVQTLVTFLSRLLTEHFLKSAPKEVNKLDLLKMDFISVVRNSLIYSEFQILYIYGCYKTLLH